jgi:hypothetical protein
MNARLKGHPSPCGLLFKHHRQHPIFERMMNDVVFKEGFDMTRALKQVHVFFARQVGKL